MSSKQENHSSPAADKLEARVVLLGEIIVACNKPVTKLLLIPREELLGQSFLSFSVAEQSKSRPPAVVLRLRTVAALAGQPQKFEWKLRRSDGTIVRVWVLMQQHRIQGKDFVQLKFYPLARQIKSDETAFMFKMGIDHSTDAVFLTDTDGQILYTNPAFETTYGYSSQEAVGKTPRILKSGVWSEEMYRNFWQALLRKETIVTNITNRTKDGQLIQIEGSNSPILDDLENLIGFLAIHREVVAKKPSHSNEIEPSALIEQEEEERSGELTQPQKNISREGWTQFRSDNDVKKMAHQFGKTPVEEMDVGSLTQSIAFKSKTGERESLTAIEEQVLSTPMKVRGEIVGALGIHDDPEQPLSEEDRELLDSITVQVAEVLENTRLLEQTQKRAFEMEAVAEVSAAASSILDVDKLLETVTDLIKQRFGLYHAAIYLSDDERLWPAASTTTADGNDVGDLDSGLNPKQSESPVATAARTRRTIIIDDSSLDSKYETYAGFPARHSALAIPLTVGEELLGVMSLIAEETDRFSDDEVRIHTMLGSQVSVAFQNARLYAKQLETTERLREIDRLKSQFLASMSHELRTPLNSIIGFADVLLEGIDGPLTDQMREDVSLIRESGRHLRSLINEMLDMSKIEAGVMELHYEEIHVPSFSEDIIASAKTLGKGKDLDFNLVLEPGLDIIQADRTRLTQILLNLLSNAIKFTNAGTITLRIEKENGGLQATVIDTGIGIYDKDIPIIFEQFRKVDDSLTSRTGGTGLGLPISRSLVELHGGELQVKSIPGEGSAFRFTIPSRIDTPASVDTKKVLAIEDNQTNMSLIARVIQSEGYDLIKVVDGVGAMAMLDEVTPDLILLDINIPGVHGLELARQIKDNRRLAHVPLVATTANVLMGDRDRCLDAGCDDYLPKPLNINRLREMLHGYLD